MKSRLKGLVALTLSLVMVFALATNAWGAVRIGNFDMGDGTTTTYYYNGTDGAQGSTSDTGTGNWNAKVEQVNGVQTLTLNGLDISTTAENGISATNNLTIVLNGTNSVEATWSGGGHAVFVDGGSLTIEGDGTLTATSAGDAHYALYASDNKAIHINGGEVIANSNSDTAIVAGYVNITGYDTKVTATGFDKGISATYGASRINGSTVTATGVSTAIDVKNLTITDGTVTATSYDNIGIQAQNLTITDGEVAATGAIAGIVVNSISITGGDVTATGTNDSSYGIDSSGAVSITGGEVSANAADNGGVGIIGSSITISGENTEVDVGCETGLSADTVSIAGGSTVTIEATTGGTAINSSNLIMSGDYQWSTNGTTFTNSTTTPLKIATAAATATLYIQPATTGGGGGNTNPYPPSIYYPTPTPEPTEVVSAKTFDGGIGLYVAMSLLSVTGGAYLSKKKD